MAKKPKQAVKIDNGDWVVVCDGAKALVLENKGTWMNVILNTKEVHGQPEPGSPEQSAPAGEHDEQTFLAQLAVRLDKAARSGEARALVVVAPPRVLGLLRRQISPHVKSALKAEVEKDYVKMPVEEIAKRLTA
jgi:protein required for attachment to host cells